MLGRDAEVVMLAVYQHDLPGIECKIIKVVIFHLLIWIESNKYLKTSRYVVKYHFIRSHFAMVSVAP